MKFKNKKAQSLSLSTVVIAALVLLVLIVLVLVFTGKIGSWNTSVDSCPPGSKGPEEKCNSGILPTKIISKEGTTKYCCPEATPP